MTRKPVAVALVVFLLQGNAGAFAQGVSSLTWLEDASKPQLDFVGHPGAAPSAPPPAARPAPPPPVFHPAPPPPVFHPAPQPPRQSPPRQEPPRQAPPRQSPPRQEPPRQAPPRQAPPRQAPPRQQPPHREPPTQQPPHRQPPTQQPPHREPPTQQPPHRQPPTQQPPHRQPPTQQPPHREPPTQQPPHRQPPTQQPPHREPPTQQPPHRQPPTQQPPRPLPPVTRPGSDGQRRQLPQPRPVPAGHVIDPRRHGSEIPHPTGAPGGQVWADRHGRQLPPGHDHVNVFVHNDVNVRVVVNNWDRHDHGYYWHDWDGHRVCHHYDQFGFHWFGWYVGDVYFWTRYHDNMYWWYDPYWHRWCYLRDGHWWWQNPDSVEVVYIYSGGGYYRYEPTTGGVVMTPDPTPPVDAPPAGEDQPAPPVDDSVKTYCSQDNSRCVDVDADGNATLRDTADPPAFEPVALDSGVTEVRFSLDGDGNLQAILLLKDDGSFSLFGPDGAAPEGQRFLHKTGMKTPDLGTFIKRSPTFDLLRGMDVR